MWFSEQEKKEMPKRTLIIMFEVCYSDRDEFNVDEMEDFEIQGCLELLQTQTGVEDRVRQDLEEKLPDYYFSLSIKNEKEIVETIAEDYCEEKEIAQEWANIIGADGESYFFEYEQFRELISDFVVERS